VHEKTRPALRLLEQEGFRFRGYVDIFDAGPTMEADIESIGTIRQSIEAKVQILPSLNTSELDEHFIINTKIEDFRACLGQLKHLDENTVAISQTLADALLLVQGDSIRYSHTLS
jgi:arginine N-succinyltransferase